MLRAAAPIFALVSHTALQRYRIRHRWVGRKISFDLERLQCPQQLPEGRWIAYGSARCSLVATARVMMQSKSAFRDFCRTGLRSLMNES